MLWNWISLEKDFSCDEMFLRFLVNSIIFGAQYASIPYDWTMEVQGMDAQTGVQINIKNVSNAFKPSEWRKPWTLHKRIVCNLHLLYLFSWSMHEIFSHHMWDVILHFLLHTFDELKCSFYFCAVIVNCIDCWLFVRNFGVDEYCILHWYDFLYQLSMCAERKQWDL